MRRFATLVILGLFLIGMMVTFTGCEDDIDPWELLKSTATKLIGDLVVSAAHKYSDESYKTEAISWVDTQLEKAEFLEPYLKWVNTDAMLSDAWDRVWERINEKLIESGYDTDAEDNNEPFGWYLTGEDLGLDEIIYPHISDAIDSH